MDFARLLEDAKKSRFNIACLDLGLDLSTPQGELVANVIASVAQWERRIIGQRKKGGARDSSTRPRTRYTYRLQLVRLDRSRAAAGSQVV